MRQRMAAWSPVARKLCVGNDMAVETRGIPSTPTSVSADVGGVSTMPTSVSLDAEQENKATSASAQPVSTFVAYCAVWHLENGRPGPRREGDGDSPSSNSKWIHSTMNATDEHVHLTHGCQMDVRSFAWSRIVSFTRCTWPECMPLLHQASTSLDSGISHEDWTRPGIPTEAFADNPNHLSEAVDLGCFDLPPIPLARLPQSSKGLPSVPAAKDEKRKSKHPWKQADCHWGLRLVDYDQSNCQTQLSIGSRMPPFPPSFCRMPRRTHRELKSEADLNTSGITAVVTAVENSPFEHFVALRIQKEARQTFDHFVCLSFQNEELATQAYAAIQHGVGTGSDANSLTSNLPLERPRAAG